MKKLDPKAVWFFFFSFIFFCIFSLFFILFIAAFLLTITFGEAQQDISFFYPYLKWLWIVVPIPFILALIWAKLSYNYYRYEFTNTDFRKESGVILKSYVSIPYDRIQNIDIYRGVLARLLGLSDLKIQTAGSIRMVNGVDAEGRLPGLSREVAEQLRDQLVKRISKNGSKKQGL